MMKQTLRKAVSTVGWRFPFRDSLGSAEPVVLVYHGIPRNGRRFSARHFESQLDFLQANFDLVSPKELNVRRQRSARLRILLTFDDGLRNNAEQAAPMMALRGIPAIFFVCTRNASKRTYLWFSYLEMLDRYFDGASVQLSGQAYGMGTKERPCSIRRLRTRLLQLRPHPEKLYDTIERELPPLESFTTAEQRRDECEGMTEAQIAELASNPLFTIGAHTVDHPFLTMCSRQEVEYQIRANKRWIEDVTGRECQSIAYPISDYNDDILQISAETGFSWGFSAEKRIRGERRMQIPRVGIYYPSLTELGFKVRWGHALRTLQRNGLAPAGS